MLIPQDEINSQLTMTISDGPNYAVNLDPTCNKYCILIGQTTIKPS